MTIHAANVSEVQGGRPDVGQSSDEYDPFADAMAALHLRKAWATRLASVIGHCHPQDAAIICAAFLQDRETGGPEVSAFGNVRSDAEWWADIAPPHEVQEYVYAGMKVMASRAIGSSARRRFIAALWAGLDASDRAAFIQRVTA
jgi:hypothetical protein